LLKFHRQSSGASLALIFVVEEGFHRIRKERGFLDEREGVTLYKNDQASVWYPLLQLLRTGPRGFRVVPAGQDQGRDPDLSQSVGIGQAIESSPPMVKMPLMVGSAKAASPGLGMTIQPVHLFESVGHLNHNTADI
jgi:hypothetical protein